MSPRLHQLPPPSHQRELIVIFSSTISDDEASQANVCDDVDQLALGSGAVGAHSIFWKLCEHHFSNRFFVVLPNIL